MTRNAIFVFMCVSILLFASIFNFIKKPFKNNKTSATEQMHLYTSNEQWQAGTLTNLTAENGSIKMTSATASMIDIKAMYDLDNSILTNVGVGTNPQYLFDGDYEYNGWHYGLPDCDTSPETYAQIDLGSSRTISRITGWTVSHHLTSSQIKVSSNGTDFTLLAEVGQDGLDAFEYNTPATFRYIRIQVRWVYDYGCIVSPGGGVNELRLWEMGGTHITSAIDGGANFWSWNENTIAQTVPANTSTKYEYRTSSNGTDWTAWVGSIGSVTNRTGNDSENPTRYRYLQIKATLTNTDGASTPTIDSYTIDYHTEVKPAAPSAQTAVVQ